MDDLRRVTGITAISKGIYPPPPLALHLSVSSLIRPSPRVSSTSRGSGLITGCLPGLSGAARSSQDPAFLPEPVGWPREDKEHRAAWLQQDAARPGGPFGKWAAGRGRRGARGGGRQPMPALPARPPLCWWGTPWQPGPPGTCEPNHSETTGQTKPLSKVPRREGDTAVSVPAAPPRKAKAAKGMGGGGG